MLRAAIVVATCALASPARAGPTYYGWVPATELVPDHTIEVDSAVVEHEELGPRHERSTALVWAPAVGVADPVELAFPVELLSSTENGAAPFSGLSRFGIELRGRFTPRSAPLAIVGRGGLERDVRIRDLARTRLGLGVGYERGIVHVAGDLGLVVEANPHGVHVELAPSVGASIRVASELRLGGELHAEHTFDSIGASWVAVGPNVAFHHGRFWVAGALEIGVSNIHFAPRLNLGFAL